MWFMKICDIWTVRHLWKIVDVSNLKLEKLLEFPKENI